MRVGAGVHRGGGNPQVYGAKGESCLGQRKYAVEPMGKVWASFEVDDTLVFFDGI
jgi:hypothetical protein